MSNGVPPLKFGFTQCAWFHALNQKLRVPPPVGEYTKPYTSSRTPRLMLSRSLGFHVSCSDAAQKRGVTVLYVAQGPFSAMSHAHGSVPLAPQVFGPGDWIPLVWTPW